ncbi:hypothetical protein EZV62_001229 [Acer yangbiense]|uniref:Uncharacterized protein n=1 Tax=Acer yangbiense TaxID=1000413 RepID=A0A5C7ITG6_9ROSI|nr:hypothetical protein EZV62_001229 [Acer yangbiense]
MSIPKLTILFIALLFLRICSGRVSSLKTSEIDVMVNNVEDCLSDPEMESETSRRVLVMGKRYISYETLGRDMVPCAKPGVSYYACHQGQANPYNRGCEVITRCARDTKN